MKRSEVTVKVKLSDVLDAPSLTAWQEMCNKYGINEWCLNEGLAKNEDVIKVSLSDAERWGLVKKD